ncbi:ABC transporter permease [Histidinibacterium aquaticum]|uniref:FtsX-like permease family protein n=1 Tax=Histidinibacterium aquaticum TaxID=2613962 RepID=A0A5J5GND6_9RHOB|nr:ABC transporter permease [Histidinibacterium aquaticum]KAA9009243.1 FtsX-like permease family protein [Histidinibacterium aquaticum]
MRFLLETARLAVRSILRNVLRSALTVLGIVIGVAAVIGMVGIGQGTTAEVTGQVSDLGSDLLVVHPGSIMTGGQLAPLFDEADFLAIVDQINGIEAEPLVARSGSAVFGGESTATTIEGADNGAIDILGYDLAQGRVFAETEMRSGAPVCVIGSTVREELFGVGNPIGETIRVRQLACEVVGLLVSKGATLGQDDDNVVFLPVRTMQRRVAGSRDIDAILVTVNDPQRMGRVETEIEALMRERRGIGPLEEDDFDVADMAEVASMVSDITGILTGLLAALAAISLLVGGIGIMNIMLVSVTERTREIGIRLAVGATGGQVLLQFLVEAVFLSAIGGAVGILLGLGLAWLVTGLLSVTFIVDPVIIAVAFLFAAFVGVLFGYFPARRAARLDPIEALRHQ